MHIKYKLGHHSPCVSYVDVQSCLCSSQIDDTDAVEDVHSLLTDVPPPPGKTLIISLKTELNSCKDLTKGNIMESVCIFAHFKHLQTRDIRYQYVPGLLVVIPNSSFPIHAVSDSLYQQGSSRLRRVNKSSLFH